MCVCVCNAMSVGDYNVTKKCDNIKLVNRHDMIQHESSNVYDKALVTVSPTCGVAQGNNNALKIKQRSSRIGTWNFQGLCCDRKALEIGEVVYKNHIDIVTG